MTGLTSNATGVTAIILPIVLAVGSATCHLRDFIANEIENATETTATRFEHEMNDTNQRLDDALADTRQELRNGQENRDRRMAQIRRLFSEPHRKDDA